MTAGVRLDALTVGYHGSRRRAPRIVASGLSAQAPAGALTALLGPNGCGKSTLLRTVTGLQPALSGRTLIDGADVTGVGPAELARSVAVVLTERIAPGFLTVREIVALGRTPHLGISGRLRESDQTVIDWALDATGVSSLAGRRAAELSDGQRQRVMTARALAQQPRVLVLDEPTSFLDMPSRMELLDLLATLAREADITVLISTHELDLALRLADRLWLMTGGGRLESGTAAQVAPHIGAVFDRGRLRFRPAEMQFGIIDTPR